MKAKPKYKVGTPVTLKSFGNRVGQITGWFREGEPGEERIVYLIRCPNDACTYNCMDYELVEHAAPPEGT